MTNSRQKGARGEREARDAVKLHWGSKDCIRAAQANGSYSADLLGAPEGLHVEVKFYASIAALKFLRQAEADAREGEIPVVLMRENGDKEWTLMVRVKDSVRLAYVLSDNDLVNKGDF